MLLRLGGRRRPSRNPDDVTEYNLDADAEEAGDDKPARCLIYRDAAGKIVFRKLEG